MACLAAVAADRRRRRRHGARPTPSTRPRERGAAVALDRRPPDAASPLFLDGPGMIDNPDYKGEWKAPMIDNPDYKGPWEHPLIPNKDYAPETYAKYKDLTTVGFELWTVNGGSIFDNILVTDDKSTPTRWPRRPGRRSRARRARARRRPRRPGRRRTSPRRNPRRTRDDDEDDDEEEEHDEL